MLVIDANVALEACGQQDGFQTLGDDPCVIACRL
jgi:hypothetical protein